MKIAEQGSIPQIEYLQNRGSALVDEAMAVIADARKPPVIKPKTGTEGGGIIPPPPTPPVVKPTNTIRAAEFAQAYLETEFDIKEYVGKFRASLVTIVKDGYKVRIG